MEAAGLDLQTIFRLLRAGDAPSLTSEDLASRISSSLRTSSVIICLSLTLTENIIIRLSSQTLPQDVRIFYEDAMRSLLGEMGLMAHLVSLLGCQDQLVSHLSAKCISACVINDISISGCSSTVWRDSCAEVFQKSSPSSELDSCLYSVTAVIKGVLRRDFENKKDVLMKLLTVLDAPLNNLYTNLLPQDKMCPYKTTTQNLCKTMCVFFDLLEVLSAARLRHGVCSSVQRTIFIQSPALLHVMRTEVDYFVKKRALLLLKRTLLLRAGEDWALGEVQSDLNEDGGLNQDVLAMAEAVLQEVSVGWLKEVPVKAQASFFGGNCDVSLSGTQKDAVMLRAVSLILLKSLEIKIQSPCVKGALCNVDVQRYLTDLLLFLQHHGTHLSPDGHSCFWVPAVFAEQDDDMIESSRALIGLYLYQKSLTSSDSSVCSWGCNPHCHFILLLRSLTFDHTVLLDFLISTETCFLEYCVRYLKLLRDDWAGFCKACGHIECSDANLGGPIGAATNLPAQASPDVAQTSKTSQLCVVPCVKPSTGDDVRAGPLPRLVDYGSSDESEEEEESISEPHLKKKTGNIEVDSDRTRAKPSSCPSVTMKEQFQTEHESESLFCKVLQCLRELQTAVARLHNRGLFPYNPTSLLKLLNNIEPKRNILCQLRLATN